MSIFGNDYLRSLRMNFVFQTIGHVFLDVTSFASVVKKFVFGEQDQEESSENVEAFLATCSNITFFNTELRSVTTQKTFSELHDFSIERGKPLATILFSDRDNCRKCGKCLVTEKDGHPVVVYHAERGPYLGSRLTKFCRSCKIYEHYGYYSIEGKKHYDVACLQLPFLLSTEDPAFDMTLLNQCKNMLIVGAVAFATFSASYNRQFRYKREEEELQQKRKKRSKRDTSEELKCLLRQRSILDRRRLEEGFLLLATLEVIAKHDLPVPVMPCDRNKMLEIITEPYCDAFVKKWGNHACDVPGCRTVVVIDGNMKYAREV